MTQETLATGQQVLVPCASGDPGAFQCISSRLSREQNCRLRKRKVRMADIEHIIRGTVAVTTRATVQMFNAFNKQKGVQVL